LLGAIVVDVAIKPQFTIDAGLSLLSGHAVSACQNGDIVAARFQVRRYLVAEHLVAAEVVGRIKVGDEQVLQDDRLLEARFN
jgi:hypothetical protein